MQTVVSKEQGKEKEKENATPCATPAHEQDNYFNVCVLSFL